MQSNRLPSVVNQTNQCRYQGDGWVIVEGPTRWEIRARLESLDIPCYCRIGQPLWVEIRHATAVIQFWAVMQQYQQSRSQLADWLTACWAVRSPQDKHNP